MNKSTIKSVISGTIGCVLVAAVFNVALINFLLFPDCNRETRDCFLVEKLWGEQ